MQLRFYRKDIWKRIEHHSFQLLTEKRKIKKVEGSFILDEFVSFFLTSAVWGAASCFAKR